MQTKIEILIIVVRMSHRRKGEMKMLKSKQYLVLLLSAVVLFTSQPMQTYATEPETVTEADPAMPVVEEKQSASKEANTSGNTGSETGTITLNKTSYIIYTGQQTTYKLKAVVKPSGTVSWKSSKKSVATVNNKGVITPKKKGTTTITATANGVSATCKVTVKKPSLSLKSKATIYLKNSQTLEATAAPSEKIKWTTSNNKIAAINSKGVVTPKKTGTVTITAKANGITKKCVVTVEKPSITFSSNKRYVYAGNTCQLYASSVPSAAITWKSSDKSIATVDKNGVVTGNKVGTVKITASVPGAKTTCQVSVTANPYKLKFTQKTFMAGDTASLYVPNLGNKANVYYSLKEYTGVVEINNSNNICTITARNAGTATIVATFHVYSNGEYYSWKSECTVNVTDSGISPQQSAAAVGTDKQYTLYNIGEDDAISSITWSTSNVQIASINAETGLLTGIKEGTVSVSAFVSYADGTTRTYTSSVIITNPKLKTTEITAALYGNTQIGVTGTSAYSEMTWESSNTSVVTVRADGTLIPYKTGNATLTATIDGKTLTCQVYISNPSLKTSYALAKRDVKKQITVKGLSEKSKITYTTANKKIATVNQSGEITTCGYGGTQIVVTVDGMELYYSVDCAPQKAISAVKSAYNIMYSSTYSQAYRMTKGYYDCSSLVFRAYGKNTKLIGGTSSWAPTAALMAQYMGRTGKVVSYKAVDVSELRVGDLIFYGGANNGRYKGIYHVSMYYGNGYRLEKPLRDYYASDTIVMVARPIKN